MPKVVRQLIAFIVSLTLAVPLVVAAASAKPAGDPFAATVRPFLAKHCFSCHSAKTNTADLNLESFTTPEAKRVIVFFVARDDDGK